MKLIHLKHMPFFCLLLTGIIAPNNATAGDLTECMTEKMLQANDSVTIGNLRLECEKEIQEGAYIDMTDWKMTLTGANYDAGYIVHGFCNSKILE